MSDAQAQARAQYEAIARLVAAHRLDYDRLDELRDSREELDADDREELAALETIAGEYEEADKVMDACIENILSLETRGGWNSGGNIDTTPVEYRIVLCTGGPHVELRGDIRDGAYADTATIYFCGWGEGEKELALTSEEDEILLYYADLFPLYNAE